MVLVVVVVVAVFLFHVDASSDFAVFGYRRHRFVLVMLPGRW